MTPRIAATSARSACKILSYLVPVQNLRGVMPKDEMLRKYGLEYFAPIVAALKKGDPVELEAALDAEQTRFVRVRCRHCLRYSLQGWSSNRWHAMVV